MIRAYLNITQAELGRMAGGARQAHHALERALNNGDLNPETKRLVLTVNSCVVTALGQVKDAQIIINELKAGDYEL